MGRGTGGLRPPYFNYADVRYRLWVGDFESPPTPAHFTDVKFVASPHRKRGEGK
jgi:hypothetical protein